MSSSRNFFVRFNAIVFSLLLVVAFYLVSNKTTIAEKSMYSGKENHVITLDAAKKMTENFQKSASSTDLLAGYFGKSIYEKILAQKNCVGIRIYNAKEEAGTPVFVLVGVDASGNDIASGVVGEDVIPCPPFCGKDYLVSTSAAGNIVAMK
ncbi:MAG TPA: hypothetical protein VMM57_03680 [Bacteroidota bacterium]|nr:hypothetical protein [Bacteroidota bacterium]